jgi:hypothetical protein
MNNRRDTAAVLERGRRLSEELYKAAIRSVIRVGEALGEDVESTSAGSAPSTRASVHEPDTLLRPGRRQQQPDHVTRIEDRGRPFYGWPAFSITPPPFAAPRYRLVNPINAATSRVSVAELVVAAWAFQRTPDI